MTDQYQIQIRQLADDLPDFSYIVELQKYGTDKQYNEWIRKQPSCLGGGYSEFVNGEWKNPACHVRRAATSGTAYKPPFGAIPMTHAQHHIQTVKGEAECLNRFKPKDTEWTVQEAKEFFDKQLEKYRKMWVAR